MEVVDNKYLSQAGNAWPNPRSCTCHDSKAGIRGHWPFAQYCHLVPHYCESAAVWHTVAAASQEMYEHATVLGCPLV